MITEKDIIEIEKAESSHKQKLDMLRYLIVDEHESILDKVSMMSDARACLELSAYLFNQIKTLRGETE